jgi:RNA-directed DNA polymerase
MSSRREGDAGTRAETPEPVREVGGGTAEVPEQERQARAARSGAAGDGARSLIDEALRRENMATAHARVVSNGGAPGIDGMTVEALGEHCREHWPRIRQELLGGTYEPQPVRRVEIPKPGGGTRTLGIPTVLDRMIQQTLHQVLSPIFDPTFSDGSFGFRPGRGTHDAVVRAREHIAAGYRWVVDLDLAKFFDTVNHDVLMRLVAKRVKNKPVLRLIGRYLRAGMLEGGVASPRTEGTPQGGPLSPLLSNILLDELDKELERRGHRFVRYADDCNVYVRSKAAGERVMASLEGFLTKRLRLKVNRDKSAVARPWDRTFLGYSFTRDLDTKPKVARRSVQRLKDKLRATFRAARGRRLKDTIVTLGPIIRGWTAYYRLSRVANVFEELDQWLRRKLRAVLWRQWKRPRTRAHELQRRGLATDRARLSAYNGRGPWWNAGASHMNAAVPLKALHQSGLVSFVEEHRRLARST